MLRPSIQGYLYASSSVFFMIFELSNVFERFYWMRSPTQLYLYVLSLGTLSLLVFVLAMHQSLSKPHSPGESSFHCKNMTL